MCSLLSFVRSRSCLLLPLALGLISLAHIAFAHDGQWSGEMSGTGPNRAVEVIHQDQIPFTSNYLVTATNSGTEPWGDFHFGIFDPIGGQNISNIHFLDSRMGGQDPASSQSPLTWIIDNVVVGARIDLYFYGDPVLPGETAWFQVYIDNPDHVPFFGVLFYPTPQPPVGACCFLDGTCQVLIEAQCIEAPRVFRRVHFVTPARSPGVG